MKPGIFLLIGLVILDVGLFASIWYWLTPSVPTTSLAIPLFAIVFTTVGAVFMGAGYIADQVVTALGRPQNPQSS
jgi:hypothetical protein